MGKINKTRTLVLGVMAVIALIVFILAVIPNSPFISSNACMNNEKAKTMYASKDVAQRNKYIEKRNEQCKEMLKYVQDPKTAFEEIDTCNMVDSVMDASKHYMDLHKNNKSDVRSELKFLANNIKRFNYCPQYNDVVNFIDKSYKEVK